MNNRFDVHLFCRQQREPDTKVVAQALSEKRTGASAGAVAAFDAVVKQLPQ